MSTQRKARLMENQISWHAELQVKPGQWEALRALTVEMVASTQPEPGALIYERFVSADRQIVHVFERYSDPAAAVAHLASFAALYGERFSALVERKKFTVFGTPSAELKQILDRFGATYSPRFAGFARLHS